MDAEGKDLKTNAPKTPEIKTSSVPKKPGGKSKFRLIIIIVLAILILVAIGYGMFYILKKKEIYRPKQDEVSRELPANAGTTRLNLPVALSGLKVSSNSGLGGLGIDTDDASKTEYVTIDIASGTEIQSMASGTVTKVDKKGEGEFEMTLNFSYGLWGKYFNLKEALLKEGDNVREGEVIAKANASSQPGTDQVKFALADENRTVGKKSDFSNGVIVAPLDYLKPDVKMFLLEKYK